MKQIPAIVFAGLISLVAVTSVYGDTIFANDDVFVETSTDGLTTTTYDGYVLNSQVVFGLAAANGVSTGRRRSYVEFTIGPDPVASATFMIYNYWGANMGGGGNPAGSGSLRLRATPVGTPVTITEPALTLDTTWVPPADGSFTSTINTISVTAIGWQSIDVTAWYNARLNQTTTLALRGQQVGGSDFPIYEDRENTAFLNGSDNTIVDAGPRLVTVVPEPSSLALATLGTLALLGFRHRRHF
ncbi:MAG: PEP-CTERM sorting domain-containing protein [Verrucomicrobiota bacterium]